MNSSVVLLLLMLLLMLILCAKWRDLLAILSRCINNEMVLSHNWRLRTVFRSLFFSLSLFLSDSLASTLIIIFRHLRRKSKALKLIKNLRKFLSANTVPREQFQILLINSKYLIFINYYLTVCLYFVISLAQSVTTSCKKKNDDNYKNRETFQLGSS